MEALNIPLLCLECVPAMYFVLWAHSVYLCLCVAQNSVPVDQLFVYLLLTMSAYQSICKLSFHMGVADESVRTAVLKVHTYVLNFDI